MKYKQFWPDNNDFFIKRVRNKLTDKLPAFADNKVLLSHSNKMLTPALYNIAAINF
jgi:hypothetical protein